MGERPLGSVGVARRGEERGRQRGGGQRAQNGGDRGARGVGGVRGFGTQLQGAGRPPLAAEASAEGPGPAGSPVCAHAWPCCPPAVRARLALTPRWPFGVPPPRPQGGMQRLGSNMSEVDGATREARGQCVPHRTAQSLCLACLRAFRASARGSWGRVSNLPDQRRIMKFLSPCHQGGGRVCRRVRQAAPAQADGPHALQHRRCATDHALRPLGPTTAAASHAASSPPLSTSTQDVIRSSGWRTRSPRRSGRTSATSAGDAAEARCGPVAAGRRPEGQQRMLVSPQQGGVRLSLPPPASHPRSVLPAAHRLQPPLGEGRLQPRLGVPLHRAPRPARPSPPRAAPRRRRPGPGKTPSRALLACSSPRAAAAPPRPRRYAT